MSDDSRLSDQLTDEEWLAGFRRIGLTRGTYAPLGPAHASVYLERSSEALVVSFDTLATARSGCADGLPYAMHFTEAEGCSHLSMICRDPTWFRDERVYDFFDRLADDGFFESFERVVFYGVGMSGYAAAAFSVAAPGAFVVIVAPQATLDPEIAPWDDRFIRMRRTNFRDRYGYAPDMLDAVDRVALFYDPLEDLDAMHAALFRGPQVWKIRVRHGGAQLGKELEDIDVIADVLAAACRNRLTETRIYRLLRRRHDHVPYLANLLNRVHVDDRPWLVALLCRAASANHDTPRFRHHLKLAEEKLAQEGRSLPPMRKRRKVRTRLTRLMELWTSQDQATDTDQRTEPEPIEKPVLRRRGLPLRLLPRMRRERGKDSA